MKFKGNNKTTVVKHESSGHKPFTMAMLLRELFTKKQEAPKNPIVDPTIPVSPSGIEVNHIAVVLDGVVQDVLRTQNKFAALILSEPEFILFNPEDGYPVLGETLAVDGKLVVEKPSEKED